MKLKNMWKRFWTLDVHNHEGFTLVELIIVIAILAILSTGAIAGYSAYVESANKTADKAMIAEIENVLLMAYYNGDITKSAEIALTADGVANADELNSEIQNALSNAYGSNWSNALKLKYEWNNSNTNYAGTSFAGKETALLNKVDSLTSALNDAITEGAGANFEKFMGDNGIAVENAGGAAVLYIAQATAGLKTAEQKKAFTDAITTNNDPGKMVSDLMGVFGGISNGGHVAAVAAVYALAEVYSMENNLGITLETDNITDINSAVTAVGNMFEKVGQSAAEKNLDLGKYLEEKAADDAAAYLDIMTTVNTSKSAIIDRGLGNFSALSSLFEAYAEGGVFIMVQIDSQGIDVINTIVE